MAYLIFITVVWLGMFTYCHGQCAMAKLPEPTPIGTGNSGTQMTGCVYKGMFIEFGSTVIKDCYEYGCANSGAVSFCFAGVRIVSHPPDCKVVPADNGCGTKAVKIDDESIECTKGVAAVGRRLSPLL